MSSTLFANCRCVAFKAGTVRRARQARQPLSVCTNATKGSSIELTGPPVSAAAAERQPRGLETTALTLLASGIIAGSCLAVDSPESAAQAVQAAKLASDVLRPLFGVFTVLYIVRVPMTWYPDLDGTTMPWLIAYAPTEPTLRATRKVIPLVSGVDVSPIVWVGILSFLNEILLGPQGLLTLIQARGGM